MMGEAVRGESSVIQRRATKISQSFNVGFVESVGDHNKKFFVKIQPFSISRMLKNPHAIFLVGCGA